MTYVKATNWSGISRHSNGLPVSKFCRPWHHYTHYQKLCKNQKCFDDYDLEYNDYIMRQVGRVENIDSGKKDVGDFCLKEAKENMDL